MSATGVHLPNATLLWSYSGQWVNLAHWDYAPFLISQSIHQLINLSIN